MNGKVYVVVYGLDAIESYDAKLIAVTSSYDKAEEIAKEYAKLHGYEIKEISKSEVSIILFLERGKFSDTFIKIIPIEVDKPLLRDSKAVELTTVNDYI